MLDGDCRLAPRRRLSGSSSPAASGFVVFPVVVYEKKVPEMGAPTVDVTLLAKALFLQSCLVTNASPAKYSQSLLWTE